MKHERSRALFDYWDEVRGTRRAPRRLEIEPHAIASLLPNVFILERLDTYSFRVRLAGTQICAYCGEELRGRLFTSLWPAEERTIIENLLRSVTEDGSGALAGLEGKEPQGRVATFEMLLLPLATSQGTYDRILGTLNPIEHPFWLGAWPVVAWAMKSSRIVWPSGEPPILDDDIPLEFGAPQPTVHRHLTVIEGGLSHPTD